MAAHYKSDGGITEKYLFCQDINPSVDLEEPQKLVEKNSLHDQDLSTETKENVDSQKIDEAIEYLKQHVTEPETTAESCLDCKNANNLLLRYCENCGKKLFKVCPKCRGKNTLIANFCQHCGKEFSQEKEEAFEAVLEKQKQSVGILVKPYTVNSWTSVSRHGHVRSSSSQTVILPKSEIFDIKDLPDASAS